MPANRDDFSKAQTAIAATKTAVQSQLDGLGDTAGNDLLGGVRGVLQTCKNHLIDEETYLNDVVGPELKQAPITVTTEG